ncbi:hypothetical protein CN153_20610 [Sinorhizobium meliloti]|nr:hypothetical protein CN199_13190 [Sinorhizobium meliloti]RVK83903.1 hypothetical protein CN153_20610 [Sinorhizobium meliloti]RVL19279.1 hypothetical protein CN143_16205 [Sinorhizobium meliloti]RVP34288.1 hypothetical protein CN081_24030 [Sinorhizobium meliloti]
MRLTTSRSPNVGIIILTLSHFSGELTQAHAQTIAGHTIGEDRSVLGSGHRVSMNTPLDGYTTVVFSTPSGVKMAAIYQDASQKVVEIEVTPPATVPGASGQFGNFKFGQTSLADIRYRFGSKGLLFGNVPPATATSDGGVAIVSSYEITGTNLVISFTSKVSRASLADLKQRFGDNMYSQVETVATLESTVIADANYLKLIRGDNLVYDVGYAPVLWENAIAGANAGRQISLARVSPTQLPVHTIYNGPINAPYFTDASARNFQTRISEGMAAGPTYAGEYAVIPVGCGAGCSIAFAASVRTGKVTRIPVDDEAALYLDLQYQIDSRLLITQSARGEARTCHMQFLTLDDGEWVSLLEHEIGPTESCYNSIAQNLQN